jgi:L-histidine Nalpha-methyltransferase
MSAVPRDDGEFASEAPGSFAGALLAGLRSAAKHIPCKYLYDAEGSALFERICTLPEYYPTRTELALLATHAAEFADCMGPDVELVEFGAGSGQKVRLLLDALCRPRAYVPIDISRVPLEQAASEIAADYPALVVRPLAVDYTRAFHLGAPVPGGNDGSAFSPDRP